MYRRDRGRRGFRAFLRFARFFDELVGGRHIVHVLAVKHQRSVVSGVTSIAARIVCDCDSEASVETTKDGMLNTDRRDEPGEDDCVDTVFAELWSEIWSVDERAECILVDDYFSVLRFRERLDVVGIHFVDSPSRI